MGRVDLAAEAALLGLAHVVCAACGRATPDLPTHIRSDHLPGEDAAAATAAAPRAQPLRLRHVLERAKAPAAMGLPFVSAYTMETPIYRRLNASCRAAAAVIHEEQAAGGAADSQADHTAALVAAGGDAAAFAGVWGAFLAGLDAELSALPAVPDAVVYRGVAVRFPDYAFRQGATLTFQAPTSSTLDPRVACSFLSDPFGTAAPTGTLFVIRCSSGRNVSAVSPYPKEAEIMLRAGARFRVVSRLDAPTKALLSSALRVPLHSVDVVELCEVALRFWDHLPAALTPSEEAVCGDVIRAHVSRMPYAEFLVDGHWEVRRPPLANVAAAGRLIPALCGVPHVPVSVLRLALAGLPPVTAGRADDGARRKDLEHIFAEAVTRCAAPAPSSSPSGRAATSPDAVCYLLHRTSLPPAAVPPSARPRALRALCECAPAVLTPERAAQLVRDFATAWAAPAAEGDAAVGGGGGADGEESFDIDVGRCLRVAARAGHPAVCDVLIAACGAHPHAGDRQGRPPLFFAAAAGHAACVRMLMRHGAAADAADRAGSTPVAAAARGGHPAVVEILLAVTAARAGVVAAAAAAGRADVRGYTPLYWAAAHGHVAVVESLLRWGARASPPPAAVAGGSDCGGTPLGVAVAKGHTKCAELLRAAGALEPERCREGGGVGGVTNSGGSVVTGTSALASAALTSTDSSPPHHAGPPAEELPVGGDPPATPTLALGASEQPPDAVAESTTGAAAATAAAAAAAAAAAVLDGASVSQRVERRRRSTPLSLAIDAVVVPASGVTPPVTLGVAARREAAAAAAAAPPLAAAAATAPLPRPPPPAAAAADSNSPPVGRIRLRRRILREPLAANVTPPHHPPSLHRRDGHAPGSAGRRHRSRSGAAAGGGSRALALVALPATAPAHAGHPTAGSRLRVDEAAVQRLAVLQSAVRTAEAHLAAALAAREIAEAAAAEHRHAAKVAARGAAEDGGWEDEEV